MAFNTYATVKRKVSGTMTQIYKNVPVQIDEASYDEVGYAPDGMSAADAFMIYVTFPGYTLRRGDELYDELTAGNAYNVLSKPASYPDGHVEIKTYQVVGT